MGNATRFATQYGGAVAHNVAMGWLMWDGRRWQRDEDGAVLQFAKHTAWTLYDDAAQTYRDAAARLAMAKATGEPGDTGEMAAAEKDARRRLSWAYHSQDAARLAAMLKLAATEDDILTPAAFFDADPLLLNVRNGVLDLRNGALYAHDPTFYCSRLAGAAYDPEAECPLWERFIARITGNDPQMALFLQRAAGYTLTGVTREQCLFFAHGTGANGKSTFLTTLAAIMGDYAVKMPTDALMVKGNNAGGGPSPELARLAGARLVLASEIEEGRRLAESLIKELTGGDVITARFLRQEFFDFTPQFKLWLYGNHKPVISGTDDGIWRRVRLLPFTITIPDSEKDTDLPAKLLTEADGIMAWAARGCLDWRHGGRLTAESVTQATANYRNSMDAIGQFIEERCVVGANLFCPYVDLRAAYEEWAAGEAVVSERRFADALTERGFTKDRGTGGKKIRRGLGLALTGN
jgi:putative DNA primase/helicase